VRVSDGEARVGFIERSGVVLLTPQFTALDVSGESEGC
jgi:hypothetical protein